MKVEPLTGSTIDTKHYSTLLGLLCKLKTERKKESWTRRDKRIKKVPREKLETSFFQTESCSNEARIQIAPVKYNYVVGVGRRVQKFCL